MNASGTHLRDLINSGTDPVPVGGTNIWTTTDYDELMDYGTVTDSGRNPVSKHQLQPECGE